MEQSKSQPSKDRDKGQDPASVQAPSASTRHGVGSPELMSTLRRFERIGTSQYEMPMKVRVVALPTVRWK